MIKKLCAKAVIIAAVISLLSVSCFAEDYDGYAIYRDGVALNEWHAAILNRPSSSVSDCVIHMDGVEIRYDTFNTFLASNTFTGIYKPKIELERYQRNKILGTARALLTENIDYTVLRQIDYSSDRYDKFVRKSDVLSMRCDGFVEYVYEWNDIRIYGDMENYLWDIAWGRADIRSHHSGTNITPKSQATQYMTVITTAPPDGEGAGYK